MNVHPASELFPLLRDPELTELAEDIRRHGLMHPIVVHEGQVLDGRNRLIACRHAGVEPVFVDWSGPGSPTSFVISANLHRRHLDVSQRAMIGAKTKALFEVEAKERQLAAQNNDAGRAVRANLPELVKGRARDHAAELVNVSSRSVDMASRVLRDGTRELVDAVSTGRAKVSAAAEVATLPPDEQREVIARGEKEVLAAAKAIRAKKGARKAEQKRALAERIRAEGAELPRGPFRVIAVDPPWRYDTSVDKSKLRGLVDYPDMSVEEISALPIARVAHRDCILWLWTTNAFMRVAFAVLEAWGFQEKTILTWDKEKLGVGHWLRNVTEHCILAVRGRPVVELANQTTLIREPRREHSRKPEAFYRLVEGLCPGSKLEIFARETRAGWTAWGAEMERFDTRRS